MILFKGVHSNDRFDQMEGEMFLNGKEISQDYYEDVRKFTKIFPNYVRIKILNNFLHRVLSVIFFRCIKMLLEIVYKASSFTKPLRNLYSGSFYTNYYDKVLPTGTIELFYCEFKSNRN